MIRICFKKIIIIKNEIIIIISFLIIIMCNIVKYNLEQKKIEFVKKEAIRLSNFLPKHMSDIIEKLKDTEYIFGVQYKDTNDIQLGITGGVHKQENWKRTVTREMGEELKLYPYFNKIQNKKVIEENNRIWFCCSFEVSSTTSSINQSLKQSSIKREKKKKIGVIVHGDYYKLYEILRRNYDEYKPNDDITHICIISVKWVRQYLDLINKCEHEYITINY